MNFMNERTRRVFLKTAGATTLAVSIPKHCVRAAQLDKRLVLGVIGTGGMGTNHLKTLCNRDDVKLAYVCDVDKDRLAAAAATVQSMTRNGARAVGDLRRILDDQSLDAVYIATPDH